MAELEIKKFQRIRVTTPVGTKSLTKQSETESTNIHTIMRKYEKTGVIDHWNDTRPTYGDFSMSQGLMRNMEIAQEAKDEFSKLDSRVRRAADNNPVKLLELMTTPEGMHALHEAGMIFDPPIEIPEPPTPPEPPVPE